MRGTPPGGGLVGALVGALVALALGAPAARTQPVVTPPRRPVITREALFDAANRAAGHLARTGAIPASVTVSLPDGQTQTLSAVQTLYLFARAGKEWLEQGSFPDLIPVPTEKYAPPAATAPDNRPNGPPAVTGDHLVRARDLLAQCRAITLWMDRLKTAPDAVWIGSRRVSAAAAYGGLAALLQYTALNRALPDQVYVTDYRSPADWVAAPAATAATGPPVPMAGPASGGPPRTTAPPAQPTLRVTPGPGAHVSGVVTLVASYDGPAPAVVSFVIDGTIRSVSNWPPYLMTWDTRHAGLGSHHLAVRAVDSHGQPLVSVEGELVVTAPADSGGEETTDEEF